MYVIKFPFLFFFWFLCAIIMCFDRNITNFSTFCHFSFEGGGGVKKETKGIKFLSDIAPRSFGDVSI